jgi:hypothetical protein
MPSLFDVQMREAELRNPNVRSNREVGSPAFERELEAMVQSRASQGTQPMVTQQSKGFSLLDLVKDKQARENASGRRDLSPSVEPIGLLGTPPQSTGRQRGPVGGVGLLADGIDTDIGLGQTRTRSQREAGTNLPPQGDQFSPDAESFNALGFETLAGSQEELMQDTAETMSNLKTGKDVTPKQASDAAEVVKQDTVAKGGDVNMFKEAPEGVDKGVWESFNGQFDLTTIGLTLLATNGNGKNLAANMGLALQAGLESKKRDNGSKANAKVKAEDRALAAKKTASEIKKNDSIATKNISEAVKNASESSGVKLPKLTSQGVTQGASYLQSAGVNGKLDNPEFRNIAGQFSQVVEGIRLEGEIVDPDIINQRAFEFIAPQLEGTSFWQSGEFNVRSVADRQGQ